MPKEQECVVESLEKTWDIDKYNFFTSQGFGHVLLPWFFHTLEHYLPPGQHWKLKLRKRWISDKSGQHLTSASANVSGLIIYLISEKVLNEKYWVRASNVTIVISSPPDWVGEFDLE